MAEIGITLGYGGGARLGDSWVFVTGGSLSRAKSIPLFQPLNMPIPDSGSQNRYQVNYGDGVYSFTGSVNFDLTDVAVSMMNDFTTRNYEFDTVIHDGHVGYLVQKCKADSFTISSSPQSLVTGTVSFQSTNNSNEEFQEFTSTPEYIFDAQQLIEYWNTGADSVESFSLTVGQALTPVYLNTDATTPEYIRAGGMNVSLSVTAWADWLDHKSVKIGNSTFTINYGAVETMDFNYGGQTETGSHVYTFKAYSETDSESEIFTIT